MFNPNGTFKWSVDLATMIYSNPEANTTWEYIYPQICKYLEDRGKTCSLQELGDKRIISVDKLDITVMSINDTIAIGDNYNDISMIKEAGLGVCVSSAENDVKKICNYICEKDYFEGAVKELIDKFILKIS
jgi:3-deoxy-D-manno-octulosonate 8-phosphate phosphatase KdsC-like HAD superfamily phosphatase